MSFSENFDGVTPPALPGGWTFAAQYTTAATGTSPTPVSAPNVLSCTTAVANTQYFATFNTQDGNSGNVVEAASFYMPAASTTMRFGLLARGSATPLNNTSTNFYRALLEFDNAELLLQLVQSGTASTFQTVVAGITSGLWYTLYFTLSGTSLSAALQRVADGQWYVPGSWQSSYGILASASDGTLSGQGYSGITTASNGSGGQTGYIDSWSLVAGGASVLCPPVVVPAYRYAMDLRPGIRRL